MPGGRVRWEWVGPIPLSIRLTFVAGAAHLLMWAVAVDNTHRCITPAAMCGAPWVRTWAQDGKWINVGFLSLIVLLTVMNRSKLRRVR